MTKDEELEQALKDLDRLQEQCDAWDAEMRSRLAQLEESDEVWRAITERIVELSERSDNAELIALCKRARAVWAKQKVH